MSRFGFLMATYFCALAFGVSVIFPPSVAWIWNASPSAPVGLYAVRPANPLFRGELVVLRPPTTLALFLAGRGYLPRNVPLIKYVAALAGQQICRHGAVITIDGREVAAALDSDRRGRLLPLWSGCRELAGEEVFLLNPAVQDSFDGRYFGALPVISIIGRAAPVWVESGG